MVRAQADTLNLTEIPQVLNAALTASVFICAAQALAQRMPNDGWHFGRFDWLTCWCASMIFAWAIKNFTDDYRAFAGPPDNAFNLGFTVLFSALAYTALAIAASALKSGPASLLCLGVYFIILGMWSGTSFLRRKHYSRTDNNAESKARMEHRKRWASNYLAAAILVFGMHFISDPRISIRLAIVIGGMYFVDLLDSKTFRTNPINPPDGDKAGLAPSNSV